MKLVLILFLLCFSYVCKADNPRWRGEFTSPNGKYLLRMITEYGAPEAKWSLTETATQKEKYQLTGRNLYQMTLIVSDDGNSVVAIDDWSEQDAAPNLDVLFFYKKGELIKKYTLGELNGMDAIGTSVSHFLWVEELPKTITKDSKIELKTLRLFDYQFNVKTGKMLEKKLDSRLTEDSIYAAGMVVKELGEGKYVFEIYTLVQGIIPESGKVEFQAEKGRFRVGDSFNIIITDGKYVSTAGLSPINSGTFKGKLTQ